MGNPTDIAVNALLVIGWLCLATYGVVWCGTRAYFTSKNRVVDEWNNQQGD